MFGLSVSTQRFGALGGSGLSFGVMVLVSRGPGFGC